MSVKSSYIFFFHVYGCFACKSELHMRSWYPGRPAKGVTSAGAGVTDCCEAPQVMGIKPRFSGRATSALNTEPPLQPPPYSLPPPTFFFLERGSHYVALASP